MPGDRCLDGVLAVRLASHVACHEAGGASRAEVRQRLASLLLAAASHHHPGTLAQERVRDGPAETASAACHQGHTTVELT